MTASATVRGRVADHFRSPLTRSGYALLLSSVLTSVLGLVYWVLAARYYHEGELGRGAALVSAMILVTSLATAGLKRGLIRFVPTAGSGAAGLIVRVYLVGLALCMAFAVALLLGFHRVADHLTVLQAHPWAPAVFLVGAATWSFFVLQDAALIGAHRATVVPASNAGFSILKILLLIVFAGSISREWGVYLSWVVPAAITAIVVNAWLFDRGLRRIRPSHREGRPTLRQVVRFTSAEYVAALVWQSAIYMTPLLVLARAGAVANAHYYLASQLASTW
jgi:O-antigen/teichoic acid export membrane protein